jgi:uncharacterized protein
VILVSVQPGQEVLTTLALQCREQGILNAAVVSIIGAVDNCTISTMARDDYRKDIVTEYDEPMELSGTGEVKDGTPHLHVSIAGEGDSVRGGHLHSARVEHFFVNLYLEPL